MDDSFIKVLVVDDSSIVREGLKILLEKEENIKVVGEAGNGNEAISQTAKLKPDVITMDVNMPEKGGLEAIEEIMAYHPTPILVITSIPEKDQANLVFQALKRGALELIAKPDLTQPCPFLATKVKLLSEIKVIPHPKGKKKPSGMAIPNNAPPVSQLDTQDRVILVGASAGGPASLSQLLCDLPEDFPGTIVIAQHIPNGFAPSLANWLDEQSSLPVKLAQDGQMPMPGTVLLAPDGHHTTFAPHGKIELTPGNSEDLYCPSITKMMASGAEVFGNRVIGVLLTGMGDDGVDGLDHIQRAGGYNIVEDKSTCLVFGMPGRAMEKGVVHEVRSRYKIAGAILRCLSSNQGQ